MSADDLFRREAVLAHAREDYAGRLLRLDSGWSRWLGWTVVLLVIAGAIAVVLVRVPKERLVSAVVIADRRSVASAPTAGRIAAVRVVEGDQVAAGTALVEFDDGTVVRASEAGSVSALLIAPTQAVAAGQRLAVIADTNAGWSLVALLPADAGVANRLRARLAGPNSAWYAVDIVARGPAPIAGQVATAWFDAPFDAHSGGVPLTLRLRGAPAVIVQHGMSAVIALPDGELPLWRVFLPATPVAR